jgi:hypothetical protein
MAITNPWNLIRSGAGDLLRTANGREIDIRNELHKMLYGDIVTGVLPHGRILVVRHFRRDSENERVKCEACGDLTGGSPHKNVNNKCRFCAGEGFLFNDSIHTGYIQNQYPWTGQEEPFGILNINGPTVFFEYYVVLTENDKILEPALDTEGKIVNNIIVIEKRFSVEDANVMRGDFGRIEYIRARIAQENTN